MSDGLDANLSNRSAMSTSAIANAIHALFKFNEPEFEIIENDIWRTKDLLVMTKDDYAELKSLVDELYYRHVIKPTQTKNQEGVNNL